MIESMDHAVGIVLAALDTHDLQENTLVVFTSDNGGVATSEGHPTSNVPLRAGKGWMYEGGIRVPTVVRWPAGFTFVPEPSPSPYRAPPPSHRPCAAYPTGPPPSA